MQKVPLNAWSCSSTVAPDIGHGSPGLVGGEDEALSGAMAVRLLSMACKSCWLVQLGLICTKVSGCSRSNGKKEVLGSVTCPNVRFPKSTGAALGVANDDASSCVDPMGLFLLGIWSLRPLGRPTCFCTCCCPGVRGRVTHDHVRPAQMSRIAF